MSCRVFNRDIEKMVLSELFVILDDWNCHEIIGEYIPTKKNRLVSDLYEKLGYNMIKENNGDTMWELKVFENHSQKNIFIERVDLY